MCLFLVEKEPRNKCNNFEKIAVMKELVGIENKSAFISEETLQEIIDKKINRQFLKLLSLMTIIYFMPDKIKRNIENILSAREHKIKYYLLYKLFKLKFYLDPVYKNYEFSILYHLTNDALLEYLSNIDKSENDMNVMKKILIEEKIFRNILLFNLISDECDDILHFQTYNLMDNVPLIYSWYKKNKDKHISKLTNDEYQVIAGLLYSLSNQEILNMRTLSSKNNVNLINNIILNLPSKFSVNNITQVLFRILILSPLLLKKANHEDIIEGIKTICKNKRIIHLLTDFKIEPENLNLRYIY